MRIKVLGCGSSNGVPELGKGFEGCNADNLKNRRKRSSILITDDSGCNNILIDAGPDLRRQLIEAGNPVIQDILITHAHYDHINGLGELDFITHYKDNPVNVYFAKSDEQEIFNCRGEIFLHQKAKKHIIEPFKCFSIGPHNVVPVLQYHGKMPALGFRIGNFSYSTDLKTMPKESLNALKGLDVWMTSLIHEEGSDKFANLNEILAWCDELEPKQVYLTHMSRFVDYDEIQTKLPDYIKPVYDGMTFFV